MLAAFLQGDSVDEIARQLSKSPRTVRRALARTRSLVEREILGASSRCETSPEAIPPLANPLPYSDFRLERLIGAGGMGKVYRATKLSTGETVAVKALRKDRQTDRRAVRQFLHEAEVVAGLNHPSIIRVHGLGRFPSGGYFLVMDWVDGVDLQTRIDQRPLEPAEALRLVAAVAEAITYAHQAGVVHCDLKPANILLARCGKVVVTDFGFAQIIAGRNRPTAIGGTPGYLAPELLEPGSLLTPAADVYSLGKLFEKIIADVSGTFAELRRRAVALDPAKRPPTAEAFLSQFHKATSSEDQPCDGGLPS